MNVTDDGIPVPDVIDAVKRAIKAASVSATDQGRDMRVASVGLILHAIATRSSGGGLNFRVPFIGMEVQLGAKVTTRDTHQIDISLTPPAEGLLTAEIRDGGLDDVLTEAIETIRAAVASAATGDDPFVLGGATITLSFAVTKEGSISIGVNGSLGDELTHTLTLALVPVLYGRGYECGGRCCGWGRSRGIDHRDLAGRSRAGDAGGGGRAAVTDHIGGCWRGLGAGPVRAGGPVPRVVPGRPVGPVRAGG